jgi:hypothetical protein
MSPGSRRRALVAAVVVAFTAAAPAAAAPPTVQGPIPESAEPGHPSRDYIFYATPMDLRKVGYVEREYFVSGTATRYDPDPDDPLATQRATLGTMSYTTRTRTSPRMLRRAEYVSRTAWTQNRDVDAAGPAAGQSLRPSDRLRPVRSPCLQGVVSRPSSSASVSTWRRTRFSSRRWVSSSAPRVRSRASA